jgi:hypothetical protein
MRYYEIITEHSLGKLYKHEKMEAVGYWYNPKNGAHATIAWEAADGVNAHSDHADYPWENPKLFGLTKEQLEDWGDTDAIRHGLVMMGWARIGFNTTTGMRMDVKNAKIGQLALRWFVEHHGMPPALSLSVIAGMYQLKHYNMKGDQVEAYARNGRIDPTLLLVR